jgi:hypothetical protein
MNELLQPDATTQQGKKSFRDLCVKHNYHFLAFKALAESAGVERAVINNMYLGRSIRKSDAEAVLDAFSAATKQPYSLDTVAVPLLPTLADLHKQYQFNLTNLLKGAGVTYATVSMMLNGQKVTKHDACEVLAIASHHIHMPLTLENTDVAVFDEETRNE